MSENTCERNEVATTTVLPPTNDSSEASKVSQVPAAEAISNAVPGWILGVAAVLVCVMRLTYT